MKNETKPETPQNTELVAKIRAVIESHACWDRDYSLQVEEYDFDDLAKDIAETFAATSAPDGKDSLRGSCQRSAPDESEWRKLLERAHSFIVVLAKGREPFKPNDYVDAMALERDMRLALAAEGALTESPSKAPIEKEWELKLKTKDIEAAAKKYAEKELFCASANYDGFLKGVAWTKTQVRKLALKAESPFKAPTKIEGGENK